MTWDREGTFSFVYAAKSRPIQFCGSPPPPPPPPPPNLKKNSVQSWRERKYIFCTAYVFFRNKCIPPVPYSFCMWEARSLTFWRSVVHSTWEYITLHWNVGKRSLLLGQFNKFLVEVYWSCYFFGVQVLLSSECLLLICFGGATLWGL